MIIPREYVEVPLAPAPATAPSYRVAVFAMGTIVAVLVILAAYFTDRAGGVDEIGLYNPPYMALHFGKMTYPVHGYFNNMVVHPPVHYEMIAMAMRLGFNSYYAEATPTLFMLLLGVLLIVFGPFPGPVKIGLLYGVWVAMAVFGRAGIELFGTRPEGEIEAAWMAGLVALESGRLENWNVKKLFLGSLLITYSASLHYYATAAMFGVGVYMVWGFWKLGRSSSRKPLLALALGGLIFGVPYLFLYVIPNRVAIYEMIRGTDTSSGILAIIREHFVAYKYWASAQLGNFWLRIPLSRGIPVVFLSTPILLAIRSTRGIALAALPLQLFLLLFAWHKLPPYYTHEIGLYSAAVVVAMLMIADRLFRKLPWRWTQYPAWALIALAMGFGWWQLAKWQPLVRRSDLLTLSARPRVHEMEIARAAGIEMLGPNARVASRIGTWYASGAAHLHDPVADVLWSASPPKGFELHYFSQFDAVAENAHMSDAIGDRHMVLLSWYLNGMLKLRGFFFAGHNDGLNYWLFTTRQPGPVTAFALDRDQLYRFAEDSTGGDEMVTFTSPVGRALDVYCMRVRLYSQMYLPKSHPDEVQQMMVAALVPPGPLRSYESMLPGSKIVQQIRGSLRTVDSDVLLDNMKREDRPMRFYRRYEDVPGVLPFKAGVIP